MDLVNTIQIQVTPVNGWLYVKLGSGRLSPWSWSKRWFVLKQRKLYYYKSPYVCCSCIICAVIVFTLHINAGLQDMAEVGVVDMSGYSIKPAPELKMKK